MELEIEYLVSWLKAGSEHAKNVASKVNISIMMLESHLKIFKEVHDEYMGKIKEYVTGHKQETNLTLSGSSAYLKEVEEQVYDILSLYGILKFKHQILELMTQKFKV